MRYIPVRINTLRASQPVGFDVFIKIGDRYLHYIRRSDLFDADRISALKSKGVVKLYIPSEGEADYLKYLDEGLNQLKDRKVTVEQRALVAQGTMTVAAENARESVQTAARYRQTEKQVQSVMEFMLSEKSAVHQMMASGMATDVYQHASHVVTLSLKLAGKAGIQDPKTLIHLGLAGLLHDIGKEGDGLDPLLPREQLNSEQRKIYQGHPERAVALVQDKAHVTKDVIEMILNHEEIGDGAGFPNKKRLNTLSMSQQILNLCNEYDRVCTVNKVAPLEAVRQFRIDKIGLFDLKLLGYLAEILATPK
jgi:HD-GYP domain-containing protein (c-di-GMP phosphodiesterase class II)